MNGDDFHKPEIVFSYGGNVHTPEIERVLEQKINGYAAKLLAQLDASHLKPSQKMDAVEGLMDGEIIPGRFAIEQGLVPDTVAAGSLDPCTRGHVFMADEARKIDPNAGLVIVRSTSKPEAYQLFPLIVRASLMRSYGLRMRILLGEGDEEMDTMEVLRSLHRIPSTVVKGRRGQDDESHTLSLAEKYGVPPDKFVQVQAPQDLTGISSGDVKGLVALSREHDARQMVSDAVLSAVRQTIHGRPSDQNGIFISRFEAGSSEAMFVETGTPNNDIDSNDINLEAKFEPYDQSGDSLTDGAQRPFGQDALIAPSIGSLHKSTDLENA